MLLHQGPAEYGKSDSHTPIQQMLYERYVSSVTASPQLGLPLTGMAVVPSAGGHDTIVNSCPRAVN